MSSKQKKLALSFAGGGARSIIYLGIYDELIDQGIKIDQIHIYSGAAMLWCYVSAYENRQELIRQYSQFRFYRFTNRNLLKATSIYNTQRLETFLENLTKGAKIENQNPKLIVSASDLTNHRNPKNITYQKGSLAKAAIKSMSIPPAFQLYQENNKQYAEAAITCLHNTKMLRNSGAEVVIGAFSDAVDFGKPSKYSNDFSKMFVSFTSQLADTERQNNPVDLELRGFDTDVGLTDFKNTKGAYTAGRKKAKQNLKKIKNLVGL